MIDAYKWLMKSFIVLGVMHYCRNQIKTLVIVYSLFMYPSNGTKFKDRFYLSKNNVWRTTTLTNSGMIQHPGHGAIWYLMFLVFNIIY